MTHTVLCVATSAQGTDASSYKLAQQVLQQLPAHTLVTRDLSQGLPVVDQAWFRANFTADEARTEADRDALALSDQLIAELQAADTVVITCPIYNFGISSALTACVDQICRAGITFRYTEQGPVGLLNGKRAILVVTSGGVPVNSAVDFATPHLTQTLHFIGIQDVQVIAADQQLTTADALARAEAQIQALVA
jgi:FMN-dependent NADH-azoreductase